MTPEIVENPEEGVEAMTPAVMNSIRDVAQALSEGKTWSMDVAHKFTHGPDGRPNLYTRGCLMLPLGLYVSERHKTQHQWFMLKGDCWVFSEESGWRHFVGSNAGVTEPGTQRLLYIVEPTVWVTAHAVSTDNPDELYLQLIEPTEFSGCMKWNEQPSVRALLHKSRLALTGGVN